MNRERLEKIGIAVTLVSAGVGVYLYHKQQAAAAAAAAAAQTPDLGSSDYYQQPETIMPSGDSTNSDIGIGAITSPPDYSSGGNGSGSTTPVDTAPPGSTTVTPYNPPPTTVTSTHTQPTQQIYVPPANVPVPSQTPTTVKPVYTSSNSHTQPVLQDGSLSSGSATRAANFGVSHPHTNVIAATY